MYIIVLKKSGTNAWDYPDAPSFFKNNFRNPDNSSQLICENLSGKTLAELTAQSSYEIVEYVGVIDDSANFRTLVTVRELIELIGDAVYLQIFKAAHDVTNNADSIALFFLEFEIAHALNGQIEINDIETTLNHFFAEDYMLQVDLDRILQGVPI